MKKLLLLGLLVILSFSLQAQTKVLRFNVSEVSSFNPDTEQWSQPFILEDIGYFQYYEDSFFHVHLPELDVDFDGKILTEKTYEDSDGDWVYMYTIAESKTSDISRMIVKFILYKDGSNKREVYIIVPKGSLMFNVDDVIDLTKNISGK